MRKYFITGLAILLPLALTLGIMMLIVNFLTNPFMGLAEGILQSLDILDKGFFFLTRDQILRYGSQALILLILFALTVVLGFITRWFFFHSLIRFGDYILHRIPFVNKLYKTLQDVIQTLFASQSDAFKQVVMVPFPSPHIYSLGLLTRNAPTTCSDAAESRLVSVFIPTTPNPTSGYLLMIKDEDITYLDMHIEDAIKFIISCGVIHPDSMAVRRMATANLTAEPAEPEPPEQDQPT